MLILGTAQVVDDVFIANVNDLYGKPTMFCTA